MLKNYRFTLLIVLCSLSAWQVSSAATRYITDEFEVTMRSGMSTSNNIVKMLKSGQIVNVIEEDPVSNYSLVETNDGKTGYVLTRFLLQGSSARQQLEKFKSNDVKQKERIDTLRAQLKELEQSLDTEQVDNSQLKQTLQISQDELDHVNQVAENTLSILDDNERLKVIEEDLRNEKRQLGEENLRLKDSTKMDWFIRGAAVSLIAFLLGIIVTRISWKKKDSWGSY